MYSSHEIYILAPIPETRLTRNNASLCETNKKNYCVNLRKVILFFILHFINCKPFMFGIKSMTLYPALKGGDHVRA